MNITKDENNRIPMLAAVVIALSLVTVPVLAESKQSKNRKPERSEAHQIQTSKSSQKQQWSHTAEEADDQTRSAANTNSNKLRKSTGKPRSVAALNNRRLQSAAKLQVSKRGVSVDRNMKKLRELNRIGEGIKQLEQLKEISKSPLERASKAQDGSGLGSVSQRSAGDLESPGKLAGQDNANGAAVRFNGGTTTLADSSRGGSAATRKFPSGRGSRIHKRLLNGNGNENRIGSVSSNVVGLNSGFGKSSRRKAPQNPSSAVVDPRGKAGDGDGWRYVGFNRNLNASFYEKKGPNGNTGHRTIEHDRAGNTTMREWTTNESGQVSKLEITTISPPDQNGYRSWEKRGPVVDGGVGVIESGVYFDPDHDDRPDTPEGENPDPIRGGGVQLKECLFKDCAVVLGMNRKKRVSAIDMISQPGRGEARRTAFGSGAAPRLGVEAVINNGDGSFGSSRGGGGYHGDPDPCDTAQGGPGCGDPTSPISRRR